VAPTLIPSLAYNNAPAAIDWLERAFGFRRHLVVPAENGTIAHSELLVGPDMVMVSSQRDNEFNVRSPRTVGARTGGIYIVLEGDVDGHCARARAAGATIIREPKDEDYGGRGYSCSDLEGQLWSFGTYQPKV
jgi:uncharacterized glyoxalase superfamily protein PhnB